MSRTTTRWLAGVVAGLTIACAVRSDAGNAAGAAELDEDHSLISTLVTPHTPWGKGCVRGRVSALFLVNPGYQGTSYVEPGTRLREVVELLQRFDIDADAVFVNTDGQFYGGKDGEARTQRLLEKKYDVYVFGNVLMDNFCPELQYTILERVVNEGASLVCCGQMPKKILTDKRAWPDKPTFFADGVPLRSMAFLAGLKAGTETKTDAETAARIVHCYRLGKGRGVALTYDNTATLAPHLKFRYRALTEYDYWMLLAGRAVLWAAGREPEVTAAAPALTCDRAGTSQVTWTFHNASAEATELKVAFTLRRTDGWVLPLPGATVRVEPNATATVPVAVPVVRADDYFLDYLATSARGLECSGAAAVTVTSPTGIESVAVDAPFVEYGGKAGVAVVLHGGPFAPDDTVRVQLRDSFGRILVRQDVPAWAESASRTFTFDIGPWCSIQMRAEAVLLSGGAEVELKETSFLVPKRRRNQFNFVQWAARGDVLEYYAWKKLGEAGWKTTLGGCGAPQAACDVSVIQEATRIVEEHDKDGIMKPLCWNEEPKSTEYIRGLVEKHQPARRQGTFAYSLGDEGTTKGCCVHPACLATYRKYLEQQYGTIARMNASWSTEYKSFDEVNLLDPKDGMEGAAAQKGPFPRWYDRQAFARWNLANFCHRFVEAFKTLDPQAVTGFEGTGGFGDDYDTILAATTFWSPYPSIGDDILRGVAKREHIRANWMGYHKQADPLINYSWRMVMKEMDSIWWWRYDGCGSWRGYIAPTLDFWPATRVLCDEMRPVREGLGDVLLKSQVRHSGIAFFYSLPSALSGQLGQSKTFPSPEAQHTGWLRAVYDLGLDMRYVTSALVKAGVLESGGFKLLVLPATQALGADEATAIRRFAENGGTVLADLRPGVFDEHCRPTSPGLLDTLFGIQRSGDMPAERAALAVQGALDGKPLALTAQDVRVDPAVAPAGAQALATAGKTPLLLVNTVGKGRAILLNFELPGRTAQGAFPAEFYVFLKTLVDAAGVRPPATFAAPDGGAIPNLETRVWQNGEMMILGLWYELNIKFYGEDGLAHNTAGRQVSITLPEKLHVWSLRDGKGLGRETRFDTTVAEGRANFFAATPYRIGGVKLRAASARPQPGTMLNVDIAMDVPKDANATYAVQLEVIDPSGTVADWGRQVVLLPGGKGAVSLPVAWDERPGTWRLRARELWTGKTDECTWKVR